MKELDIWIEELPASYPAGETRELDKWVNALGRKKIGKDIFESVSPTSERVDIVESLRRLYSRGYLTNEETHDTIKLFGGWL